MINDVQKIEETILKWLDQVLATELKLSAADSDYDLDYLTQKTAQCAVALEKIANIQAKLTRVFLAIVKISHQTTVKYKLFSLQVGRDGIPLSKVQEDHLAKLFDEKGIWEYLTKVARETGKAASDRQQLMRKLDSSLRLQQKLYESKVAAGLTLPPTFPGKPPTDEVALPDV